MAGSKSSKKKSSNLRKVGTAGLTAGRWLLEFLDAILEALPDPLEGRYAYVRRVRGWPKEIRPHRIHEEIKRMKNRGWIIEAEKQGKKFIQLTKKGRLELFYRKLQLLEKTSDKKWDGTWWMAFYDIPEDGRNERHAIRDALRLAGFYRLQKSVYIYPYAVPDELTTYLKEAKLLPYIRFVHIDKLSGSRGVEQYFKVKKSRV